MLALLLADVLPIPRNFEFSPDPEPYILVFGIGFAVAVLGHIASSKVLIAAGLLMIFLATVLLPLGIFLSSG
ncbi:MAG: hypothetical protein QOI64_319 [Solirubrobacteraceae bacterium]|jgi:hypothetical protein|nr:hypothetical protein [Solirubrobacteraceae bacterium]